MGPGSSVGRGQPAVCRNWSATGTCKYGEGCRFDHPSRFAVTLTELGLPYRPSEPVCAFYLKTNNCKFGPACKFHHPRLAPIFAGSAPAPAAVNNV